MPGLYIHIPFCKQKCAYCDFISLSDMSFADMYLVALMAEMQIYAELMSDRTFETVFIGGGTPTALKKGWLTAVLGRVKSCFKLIEGAEITVEANPESATEDKLAELVDSGVTRLSLGLQSADDMELRAVGRIHTQEDFQRAVDAARKVGFSNINADIIHGLPRQTYSSYIKTLEYTIAQGLPHISSYALILEEGTPLYERVNKGEVELPDEDAVADMEDAGFALLEEHGYKRYEISNFSIEGYECRHNLNYWNNGEYLGLGLNSHSALSIRNEWIRFENTKELREYIAELGRGRPPVRNTKKIDVNEEMFETIMLGLRKRAGVERKAFQNRFGVDPVSKYAAAISELAADELLIVDDEKLYLTNRGMDFQNEALIKFMYEL